LENRMESGVLAVVVMGACFGGCICAICVIERAFELLEARPLIEPLVIRPKPGESE
jgi:hypothetical protein